MPTRSASAVAPLEATRSSVSALSAACRASTAAVSVAASLASAAARLLVAAASAASASESFLRVAVCAIFSSSSACEERKYQNYNARA